jgi:hypothetical protein
MKPARMTEDQKAELLGILKDIPEIEPLYKLFNYLTTDWGRRRPAKF